MSGWDAYIKALQGDGKVIKGAAIYGQGATPVLWAASSATFITAEEVKALSGALTNQSTFDAMSASGFKIAGTKYMKINSEINSVIRGKAGENAASAAMSKKAIILCVGKGSPQDVSAACERMAADLKSKGY